MSAPADIERPTGLRLASQYKAIEKKGLEIPHYPRTLNPSSTSIHDLAYRQSILGNEDNLAEQTTSSIFHLMKPEAHDDELRYYIEARAKPSLNPLASTSNGLESNAPKRHSHRLLHLGTAQGHKIFLADILKSDVHGHRCYVL